MQRRPLLVALAAAPLAAHAAQRSFTLQPFTTIEVHGSLPVELVQRQPAQALVEGDEDVLAQMQLAVEDGVLRLREPPRRFASRLRVVLQVWSLERIETRGSSVVSADELVAKRLALQADGSSHVRIDRLTTEALSVQASGSAGVRVAGRANELDASVGGSAGLDAADLQVRRAGVKLGGSSMATVWAREDLDGAVGGSSNLRYRGQPRLQVARGGSARVWPAD